MNYNHQSDIDLICSIKDGDKKAFDAFFVRYYAVLCAYSKQFVHIEDGQDIVQDIMANLWINRQTILISTSPRQYFFQSVKNKCLSFLSRNELKEKIRESVHETMGYMYDSPDFYEVEELKTNIEDALARLPENYRKAFELNRFKNMTYHEIADCLSVSPKTIDYRIQQALKLLRRDLREYLPFLFLFSVFQAYLIL
jgi:RNA polymerase sigma-70 factor (ECF subfamily)